MEDSAADMSTAVICSVSARASAGSIAASHLPASTGLDLRAHERDVTAASTVSDYTNHGKQKDSLHV